MTFEPGQHVLLPGVVRDIHDTGTGRRVLVVDVGRGDGMTTVVTCGEEVPEARA